MDHADVAAKAQDPVDRNLEDVFKEKEEKPRDPKEETESRTPSANSSGKTATFLSDPTEEERRPSVKKEMKKIEAEIKAEDAAKKAKQQTYAHKNVPRKKRKTGKERG